MLVRPITEVYFKAKNNNNNKTKKQTKNKTNKKDKKKKKKKKRKIDKFPESKAQTVEDRNIFTEPKNCRFVEWYIKSDSFWGISKNWMGKEKWNYL